MDQDLFFTILVIVAVVIIAGTLLSKKAIIKRKLRIAEYKKLTDFKNGDIAKIVGSVEFLDKPLISPLSNRECSYYSILVEQKVSSGNNSHWKTIIEENVSCKFLILEDNEYAFINDYNINCVLVEDRKYSSGFWEDATENLERYIQSKGYDSKGLFGFNKTLRYKEGIIERDEEVAVFGKGEWKDASQLDLPGEYNKVLEIISNNGEPIYLSDDPSTTMRNIKKNKKKKRLNKDYNNQKHYKK